MKLLIFIVLATLAAPTVFATTIVKRTTAEPLFVQRRVPVNFPPLNISDADTEKLKNTLDGHPCGTKKQSDAAGNSNNKISHQIVGGSVATRGMLPWQVYVILDGMWLCGGSLVSNLWVLTAAHCAYQRTRFTVVLGAVDRFASEPGRISLISTTKFVHANYNPSTLNNDVAVIKLPSQVTFTQYIGSVRLPKQSDANNTFEGTTAVVSGWGKTSDNFTVASIKLNYVNLVIQNNTYSASIYTTTYIFSSTICAKSANISSNTCSGDSGGPLVMKDSDGKYTQIGVVSFGAAEGCSKGYPSCFARITSFLGWISNTTGIAIAA